MSVLKRVEWRKFIQGSMHRRDFEKKGWDGDGSLVIRTVKKQLMNYRYWPLLENEERRSSEYYCERKQEAPNHSFQVIM